MCPIRHCRHCDPLRPRVASRRRCQPVQWLGLDGTGAGPESTRRGKQQARPRGSRTRTIRLFAIYGHIIGSMAVMTIKSTFSLDVGTVRTLEGLARRWNVSKSEALRRAICSEAERQPLRVDAKSRALRALQESVAARDVDLDAWERQAGEIRSASFRRLADEPR